MPEPTEVQSTRSSAAGRELSTAAERELVLRLAEQVLGEVAPEELALIEETSEEFFADPEGVLNPRRRDEPVGFGVDAALLTPIVLAVVTPVVKYVAGVAADTAKESARPLIAGLVHRLLRQPEPASEGETGAVEPLSAEQARQVRTIAFERARALGVESDRAGMLADSVVGGVLVADG